jgi:putative holliday junction resolvase
MDGSKGPMAAEVEQFVAALGRHVEVPVDLWDERFTSLIAERAMLEADLSRRKRKGLRDKMAAQVMLQGYLDGRRA